MDKTTSPQPQRTERNPETLNLGKKVKTWLLEDIEGSLQLDAEVFLSREEALAAKQAIIDTVAAEHGTDRAYVSAGLSVNECEGVLELVKDEAGVFVSFFPAADPSVGFTRRAGGEWGAIPADLEDAWSEAAEAAGWTGADNQTDALNRLVSEHFPDFINEDIRALATKAGAIPGTGPWHATRTCLDLYFSKHGNLDGELWDMIRDGGTLLNLSIQSYSRAT